MRARTMAGATLAATVIAAALLGACVTVAGRPARAATQQRTLSVPRGAVISWVGDSLAAGYYATTAGQSFRGLVDNALAAMDYEAPGSGPGASAQSMSNAFGAVTANVRSDSGLVVVELGTNDWTAGRSATQFAADYQNVIYWIENVWTNHAPLVCVGPWINYLAGANSGGMTYPMEDHIIAYQCGAYGGVLVDLGPIAWGGPAGRATYNGVSDNFHPDDGHHELIAEAILDAAGY